MISGSSIAARVSDLTDSFETDLREGLKLAGTPEQFFEVLVKETVRQYRKDMKQIAREAIRQASNAVSAVTEGL